ncbi:MAG: RNA degradosome polyphosphate kinase [Candidatus Sericytochromatia bacterium]|nr:RNA degradosome polyphosphate kinase [Candidatus Sericytochromatia bacterium]
MSETLKQTGESPAAHVAPSTDLELAYYLINRELSWLAFNERVIEEAKEPANPLLERLKFIAIAASNLDEFFMVRVANLKEQSRPGLKRRDSDLLKLVQTQLLAISERAHVQVFELYRVLNQTLLPELQQEGIVLSTWEDLTGDQQAFVEEFFHRHVYPVVTPMAIDAGRPFPKLPNKSLNLAVELERPGQRFRKRLFAVVPRPAVLPRYLQVRSDDEVDQFILLEDILRQFMPTLFEGYRVRSVSAFRITRDADVSFDEEFTDDLLKTIQTELKRRHRGAAVRVEIEDTMPAPVRATLQKALDLAVADIYAVKGPLDPTLFMGFVTIPGFDDLRFPPLHAQLPQDFSGQQSIFEAIADKDILMHHPYESFEPVVHFIRQAAEDPNVLAIKQTLYRVSGGSPVVQALARAAEMGKQVTVLVELKARFDEEKNIVWAKQLEDSGCHVIYGLVGLKTHAKITLVVRREGDEIRRYVHLGTGNYNDATARTYTDIGLFTARTEFGVDASAFFNHLTGYSVAPRYTHFITAPTGMREAIVKLIERESRRAAAGKGGRILAKMNSLTDEGLIISLYKASQAGVQIDLIVRGMCRLRPGLTGVSDNIRVTSIVGRFLEHSRIFVFGNDGHDEVYLSSADWMNRNLVRRVELFFPVLQEDLKARLKTILEISLADTVKARQLQSDGTYVRPVAVTRQINSQELMIKEAKGHRPEKLLAPHKPMAPVAEPLAIAVLRPVEKAQRRPAKATVATPKLGRRTPSETT